MSFDQIAVERGDALFASWVSELTSSAEEVSALVERHRGGIATGVVEYLTGSFNVCARIGFLNGADAIIRFPKPGIVAFADEKVRNEVAVMKFLSEKTEIPIPRLIGWGLAKDSTCNLGPFIIMEYVEGRNLSDVLNKPGADASDLPILNPDIDEATLVSVYRQLADILLQLSEHNFEHIGAISKDDQGVWSVQSRPWTYNMNELATVGDYPVNRFPKQKFSTASTYLQELATQHLIHLEAQPNIIEDRHDCRKKYLARHLFQQLVKDKNDAAAKNDFGQFKLFCDDFRPSNILVDESLRIVAVLDWEFTYAAPSSFTYSPPWWLLLRGLDSWVDSNNLEDFLRLYRPRLDLFLRILQEREDIRAKSNNLMINQRMSKLMRDAMEDGTFWLNIASRKSWDIDQIYWNQLDRIYLGQDSGERIELIVDSNIREGLGGFISMKMEQYENYHRERLEIS